MAAPTVFSVKQPWAGLLISGVKRFEVRSWYPKEPGWLLVHASSGKAPGLRELSEVPEFTKALKVAEMTDPKLWPTSAVIGAVRIAKVWLPDAPRPKLSKRDQVLCGNIAGMT